MLRHTCFVTQTLEADPDCLDYRGLCYFGCVVAEWEATDVVADAPDSAPDAPVGAESVPPPADGDPS